MRDTTTPARVLGIGARIPHRTVVVPHALCCRPSAPRVAGGDDPLAVSARQLRTPVPRQAVLDAVDLASCTAACPTVYHWGADPALTDAA